METTNKTQEVCIAGELKNIITTILYLLNEESSQGVTQELYESEGEYPEVPSILGNIPVREFWDYFRFSLIEPPINLDMDKFLKLIKVEDTDCTIKLTEVTEIKEDSTYIEHNMEISELKNNIEKDENLNNMILNVIYNLNEASSRYVTQELYESERGYPVLQKLLPNIPINEFWDYFRDSLIEPQIMLDMDLFLKCIDEYVTSKN